MRICKVCDKGDKVYFFHQFISTPNSLTYVHAILEDTDGRITMEPATNIRFLDTLNFAGREG